MRRRRRQISRRRPSQTRPDQERSVDPLVYAKKTKAYLKKNIVLKFMVVFYLTMRRGCRDMRS